ncbi:MAG: LysM peptidoglycan-binding domain-containing protein [Bacillota bacterium]|nr:LysM peptidoglycan-binding domain-containing protein [Bacillota bacterium]
MAMDFCSEVVRRVEIPSSLPAIDDLSKICGGIILKDAVAKNNTLKVEGDLLWQGYFRNNRGEEECLWEGAEFFQEELPFNNLRIREPFMMEPEVTDISAEEGAEGSCLLTFSVRWWEDENQLSQEEESFEEEIREIESNFRDTIESFVKSGEEDELIPEREENQETVAAASEFQAEDAAEIEAVQEPDEAPRKLTVAEKRKARIQEEGVSIEDEYLRTANTDYTPQSPSYCLRYYRAKEGDSMEDIAERFSVSLAKMRGINELDEVGSIQGRMVRIQ